MKHQGLFPPGSAFQLAATALALTLSLAAPAWSEADSRDADKARAEYIRSHYAKFEYRIPMRDGKRLFTTVYLPNQAAFGQKYPFLMTRTPYSVYPYGLDRYPSHLGPSEPFEKEGFIFVQQDVRGRWMSEGEFTNMRPVGYGGGGDESSDTYDTIDWLLKHVPQNNGRVGMRGVSYPGFYTAAGAINSHPALKVISPQAPIADWWQGDDMHRHGAFCLQMTYTFFKGFGRPRPAPTDEPPEEPRSQGYGTTDAYQFFLELGPLRRAYEKFGYANLPWAEFAKHPNYDEFWQQRNLLPQLRNVNCAAMVVGGWYDTEDLYGPLQIYKTLRSQPQGARKVSLVMGPWNHGGWQGEGVKVGELDFGFKTSQAFQAQDLAYFKHHLKDGPDPGLPGAWVFETGANRWRSFSAWPPAQAQPRKLFLQAHQALSWKAPTASPAYDEFVSDPAKPVPYSLESGGMMKWSEYTTQDERFAARRPDVLVYQTEPLAEPVTLAGPLEADLWVSTSASDADWVVKLVDVNPGKMPDSKNAHRQTLVRAEPIRGRFRDDPARPKPFEPGQRTRVRFALNDVFHTFGRGHRLMIHVQSTWFPFIDRNPQKYVANIFEAQADDFIKATHRVYHEREHPSHLLVPLLPSPDQ